MTVKEIMQLIRSKEMDVDFYDDYDERVCCAYCCTNWSEKAEVKYNHAFILEVASYSLDEDAPYVTVKCKNEEDVNALGALLYSMAGYLEDTEEYDELYPEDEDDEEEGPPSCFDENLLFIIMKQHANHHVRISNYANQNMSLECEDCGCVLFDTDLYDLIGVI